MTRLGLQHGWLFSNNYYINHGLQYDVGVGGRWPFYVVSRNSKI